MLPISFYQPYKHIYYSTLLEIQRWVSQFTSTNSPFEIYALIDEFVNKVF